jgi:hypothetical protein
MYDLQYGLDAAFSPIEQLHHEVKSSENPIIMDLKQRYVIKGIQKEQIITSVVTIQSTPDGTKIEKVEDKWNGKLPDSSIQNVSSSVQLLNPFWWIKYTEGWIWWIWSFVWYTTPWRVCLASI